MDVFLGIDVGSVSTNLAALDSAGQVLATVYLRTGGGPIKAIQRGVAELRSKLPDSTQVLGAGATGSARTLTGALIGADVVKNEITAHAVADCALVPTVRTIIEIGGQDSKVILVREGVPVDFAMNTVCAAGTGSFLDHQAERLGVPIEDFGDYALRAAQAVRIAGRCTVFAESDMIHKQQLGVPREEIIRGLCEALVRNYLTNVAKGKELLPPVVFEGGVAANKGIRKAFEEALGLEVFVPEFYGEMGAIGAALLAQEEYAAKGAPTRFKGFELAEAVFTAKVFECEGCSNYCEITSVYEGETLIGRWGGRCGRWDLSRTP
jgi:predicted CoA-substrate-specific enzyme activase